MSLKYLSFSAVRWTTLSTAVSAGLSFLQLAVLARLLSQDDFGLMAIVASLIAVARLFSDLGLERAIIHYSDIPRRQLSTLFWLNILSSVMLMSTMDFLAPWLARLYNEPSLLLIIIAASFIFPLQATGQQFRIIAEKELQFSTLARIEIISALSGFALAISSALYGAGVWAIIIGRLSTVATASLLSWLWLSADNKPMWVLRIRECKKFLTFGGYSIGDALTSTIRMQSDIFISGLLFSPASVGLYSVPRDFCLKLGLAINPIVTRVSLPLMAKTHHDIDRLKNIYLKSLRMTTSVTFPLYWFLIFFSNDITTTVFGQHWSSASLYMQIISAIGMVRSTGNLLGSLVYASGRAKRAFFWNLGLLLILPPIYWVGGVTGGLPGLALYMLISQVGVFILSWILLVNPLSGASFGEYLAQIYPAFTNSLVAAFVAYICTAQIDLQFMRLSIGFIICTTIYLVISSYFNRPWLDGMSELLGLDKKLNQFRFW